MRCEKCGLDKPFSWLGGPHECPRPAVSAPSIMNWEDWMVNQPLRMIGTYDGR